MYVFSAPFPVSHSLPICIYLPVLLHPSFSFLNVTYSLSSPTTPNTNRPSTSIPSFTSLPEAPILYTHHPFPFYIKHHTHAPPPSTTPIHNALLTPSFLIPSSNTHLALLPLRYPHTTPTSLTSRNELQSQGSHPHSAHSGGGLSPPTLRLGRAVERREKKKC